MKKLFTLILAVVAVMGAGATENTTVNLYSDATGTKVGTDWSGSQTISAEKFANAKIADLITVTVSAVGTGSSHLIAFSDTKDEWKMMKGTRWFNITEAGTYSFVINATMLEKLKAGGLGVGGCDYTFTSIDLVKRPSKTLKVTPLSNTAFTKDSGWGGDCPSIDKSEFTTINEGDQILVNLTSVPDATQYSCVQLQTSDWKALDGAEQFQVNNQSMPRVLPVYLTSTLVTSIKANGIAVTGQSYTASSVDLVQVVDVPTEDIDLSTAVMDATWGDKATYNKETKTITYTESWAGCGWWYGSKDCSEYTKVVYEFEEAAPAAGSLCIGYGTTGVTDGEVGFAKGATSVEYTYDGAANHNVQSMILKLAPVKEATETEPAEYGSIKLKQIYFIKGTAPMSTTSFTRSTATGSYGTICLPYDFSATGATVMASVGRNDNGLVFEPVDEPKAGVPYLYKATADSQTFTYTGTTYAAATAVNNFTGVYQDQNVPSGAYFLYTSDMLFHPAGTSIPMGAYRCYFTSLPDVNNAVGTAKAMVFGIVGDNTTAISNVDATATNSVIADGKFIQNGKLVIVKDGKKFNTAGQILK